MRSVSLLQLWVLITAIDCQLPGHSEKAPLADDEVEVRNVYLSDLFNCTPCTCSSSSANTIQADCSNKGLFSVPTSLPADITSLVMDENRLKELSLDEIARMYQRVKNVYARNTGLRTIRQNCSVTRAMPFHRLYLDSNSIDSLENCSLHNMPFLYRFTVSNNIIVNLTNDTFLGLRSLRHLDLSLNHLKHMDTGTFDHLSSLRTLWLAGNPTLKYYPNRMKPAAFANLTSLEKLYIHGTSGGTPNYPDEVLNLLTNLQELTIDGLSSVKGPQVPELRNLKTLTVGVVRGKGIFGPCLMKTLSAEFFQGMPSLTSVHMSGCKFLEISSKVFPTLTALEALVLSYSPTLALEKAFEALSEVPANSSLRSLTFKHLISHNGLPCRYLRANSSQHIQHIPLTHLDLSENKLVLVTSQCIQALPKSIVRLNLSKNMFNINTFTVSLLFPLKNLKSLDLSQQIHFKRNSAILSSQNEHCSVHENNFLQSSPKYSYDEPAHVDTSVEMFGPDDSNTGTSAIVKNENPPSAVMQHANRTLKGMSSTETFNEKFSQPLFSDKTRISKGCDSTRGRRFPTQLRTLKASEFPFIGEYFLSQKLKVRGKVTSLDFANSMSTKWGDGKIPALTKYVNLEANFCSEINSNFFPVNSQLTSLHIGNNFLGHQFAMDTTGDVFRRLKNVKHLDISKNHIYKLPRAFFRGFKRLKTLYLSNNKLQTVNFSLSHLPQLRLVDLSANSITWISRTVRDDLDYLASQQQLQLNLTMNPLPCTCDGLEVLEWMDTTRVHVVDKDFLFCVPDGGTVQRLGNLSLRVKTLQHYCFRREHLVMIVIGCSGITVVLIIVLASRMHRYRWRLIYLKNVTMARWFGFQPASCDSDGCSGRKFDGFLVYSEEDRDFVIRECIPELEEKRGHVLCIADRDFLPGSYITTNITCAVQCSTLTVPIVTENFLKGGYCQYSTQMATYEGIFEKRQTLFVILRDQVPVRQIWPDLLLFLRQNRYVEEPPQAVGESSEDLRDHFWDQVSCAMGHVNRGPLSGTPRLRLDNHSPDTSTAAQDVLDGVETRNALQ